MFTRQWAKYKLIKGQKVEHTTWSSVIKERAWKTIFSFNSQNSCHQEHFHETWVKKFRLKLIIMFPVQQHIKEYILTIWQYVIGAVKCFESLRKWGIFHDEPSSIPTKKTHRSCFLGHVHCYLPLKFPWYAQVKPFKIITKQKI